MEISWGFEDIMGVVCFVLMFIVTPLVLHKTKKLQDKEDEENRKNYRRV